MSLYGDGVTGKELLLFEAAQHGASAWQYVLAGVDVLAHTSDWDAAVLIPVDLARKVHEAQKDWREADALPAAWESEGHQQ